METTAKTLVVRGIELDFAAMNESHIQKWIDAGKAISEKYADVMDLPALLDIAFDEHIAEKYARGTKAYCELMDSVFGKGTAKKLLGEKPCYGDCLKLYYEIQAEAYKQGELYALELMDIKNRYMPVGPSGEDL